MNEKAESDVTRDGETRVDIDREGSDRRQFLTRLGVGATAATAAWTVPMIASGPAAAAGTVTPAPPFLVVGGDGNARTFTSFDDMITAPVSATVLALDAAEAHGIAFSNFGGVDKWIAVGRNYTTGTTLMASSTNDGASWTPFVPALGTTGRLLAIATDGAGNWVTVGEAITSFPGEPQIWYSSDNGVSWSPGAFSPATTSVSTLHGLATDGTTWIAAGQNDSGNAILTMSTDAGVTWSTPIVLALSAHVFDVAYDSPGQWLAVGSLSGANNFAVAWRTNGPITAQGDWTQIGGLGSGFMTGVASDHAGTFVGVGRRDDPLNGAFSYTFQAGIVGGNFPPGFVQSLHDVGTDQFGNWLAVGWDSTPGPMRTFTSINNGLDWTISLQPDGPLSQSILLGVAAKIVA